jgi:hypothetical protein
VCSSFRSASQLLDSAVIEGTEPPLARALRAF